MLALSRVSKSYGLRNRIEAVRDVSFKVWGEEFLALVGPSGCGKTTLLKIAAGLLEAESGEVSLAGIPAHRYREEQSVGYISQSPALLPWRTASENARLPAELGGRAERRALAASIDDVVGRAFGLLGLTGYEDLFPRQLSGGMKQRVAVARALACDSPTVFMDEPFSALDAITRERLWTDISLIFATEGATALLVTHHIAEAVAMADRILVLSPRPASVVGEVEIGVGRPRSPEFVHSTQARSLESKVRYLLTEGGE